MPADLLARAGAELDDMAATRGHESRVAAGVCSNGWYQLRFWAFPGRFGSNSGTNVQHVALSIRAIGRTRRSVTIAVPPDSSRAPTP
jgi:hypothetical protein